MLINSNATLPQKVEKSVIFEQNIGGCGFDNIFLEMVRGGSGLAQ